MNTAFIWSLIGFLICVIIYLIPKHKLDQQTIEENEKLKQNLTQLTAQIASAETENNALEKQKASLNADIATISAQAEITSKEIYQKSYDLMQEKLDKSAEIASQRYQQAEEDYQQEYLRTLEDSVQIFVSAIEKKQTELTDVETLLANLKAKTQAAIEADKRRVLEEEEKNYYKIAISENALADIQILREVTKQLKGDPLPINKVIWDVYYKNPTTNLLGRITPSGQTHIGIYKITNLDTGRCYIGQSVDLRTRIRDHIKAGLGINSSNNKFYSEMKELGPEKFMYEIIEECDRAQLNERERYWINFYESIDWGYNSTIGNRG